MSEVYPSSRPELDAAASFSDEEEAAVELDEEDLLQQKLRAEKEAKKTKMYAQWERAGRIPKFDAGMDRDGYITYDNLSKKLSELELVIELLFRRFNPIQDGFTAAISDRHVAGHLAELSATLDGLELAIGGREVARHVLKGMALEAKKKSKGWTKKTVAESKRQRELLVIYKDVVVEVNEIPGKIRRIELEVNDTIRKLREEPNSSR